MSRSAFTGSEEFQIHSFTGIRFVNEEVCSSYTYPKEYKGPKPIVDQIKIIAEIFGLDPNHAIANIHNLPAPPDGAEGWFAMPRWQTLAITYGEAVEKVFAKLSEAHKGKFKNWREGKLMSNYLKQSDRTEKMFRTLSDQQKDCNILVVAAQFGLRHRGRSDRRARETMTLREFGLGAFAVGSMLLVNPERLMHYDDLYVGCTGDEYAPEADGSFSYAPIFGFDDRMKFYAYWSDLALGIYGSASAFLP